MTEEAATLHICRVNSSMDMAAEQADEADDFQAPTDPITEATTNGPRVQAV
jgi:hypothetical protein